MTGLLYSFQHICYMSKCMHVCICASSRWWWVYVKTHIWTWACVAKPTSSACCSWWWLCCVETHVWTYVCIAKLTLSASCSWWYCYMSKRTCQQVLVLPSRCLVDPAADDDFAICQNAHMDMCLCCRADV